MPTNVSGTVLRPLAGECNGVAIASQATSTLVFNTNSLAKTGSSTSGANSQFNPYGVVAGTVANHGNVRIYDVPPGASYLDLVHEWTGTNPAVRPIVRVFGSVPRRGDAKQSWPGDLDTSFFNPGFDSETQDWRPLGNLQTSDYSLELYLAGDEVAEDNGTTRRSAPRTINLCGVDRVMVLIDTAGDTATEGMVVGWFGR